MKEKGYLRLRISELEEHEGETECCVSSYVFETLDERYYEDLHNPSDAPINQLIIVEIDNDHIVSWDFFDDGQPRSILNNQVKDIAFVRLKQSGQEVTERDFESAKNRARELENFLHLVNDGRWTHIRVTPYAIEDVSAPGAGFGLFYSFRNIREKMEEQWPGRYDEHNYWHGWGGHRSGLLGEAYVNSSKAWTYTGGVRTVKHEQGHSFGSGHSSTEGNEYGDPTCIMAKARAGFNAPQMIKQKQIPEDEIVEVESGKTYFLLPVECSHIDKRSGETRILQVGKHMLSTRKIKNQSDLGVSNLSYNPNKNTIFIHKASTHQLANPMYEGKILPGESKEVDGVLIKNSKVKEDVIRVETGTNVDSVDFPQPLKMLSGDPITEQHSRLWHTPEYKHQGFDMFFMPEKNQLVGYWFTHHAKGKHNGQSVHHKHNGKEWFMLDGSIDPETNVVTFDVVYHAGRVQKKVGYGSLRIVDGKMLLRSYTENYGRDHFYLVPATTVRETPIGLYESGEYEGYTVSKYKTGDNKDIYVVYYYGHAGQDGLQWYVYMGSDPESLSGYEIEGKYKQTFEGKVLDISPISLTDVEKHDLIYKGS